MDREPLRQANLTARARAHAARLRPLTRPGRPTHRRTSDSPDLTPDVTRDSHSAHGSLPRHDSSPCSAVTLARRLH